MKLLENGCHQNEDVNQEKERDTGNRRFNAGESYRNFYDHSGVADLMSYLFRTHFFFFSFFGHTTHLAGSLTRD